MSIHATEALAAELEARLLRNLEVRHPVDRAMLGPSEARELVGRAASEALGHGFEREQDIDRYFDLMIVLGAGFADDPQLPWASRALSGKSRAPMVELWKLACAYVREDAGDDGGWYRRALVRAKKLTPLSLTSVSWTEAKQAETMLRQVHPEKFRIVQGELPALFSCAQTYCARHERGGRGVRPLYLLLMFLLGSHFEGDPRYRWASEILSQTATGDEMYVKLHAAALEQLDMAFAWMRSAARDD